jgi:hypothetical protein
MNFARYKKLTCALLLSLLGGCSIFQGSKMLAPESFGLTPVAPNIYVEADADEATRSGLRDAMLKAENAIHAAYGSVKSHPVVHACISEKCFTSFGGRGAQKAKVYGNYILLSPRGLNWHYLAHEWSHDELRTRLTFSAWWQMPQWFDEGLAVAISEAPEHSEAHWHYLIASHVPRPTRDELYSFKSLRQWSDAVGKYGESENMKRKARGESEVHPLYAAAGHEVRPWLASEGSKRLLRFIDQLNSGEKFESAYRPADLAIEANQAAPVQAKH